MWYTGATPAGDILLYTAALHRGTTTPITTGSGPPAAMEETNPMKKPILGLLVLLLLLLACAAAGAEEAADITRQCKFKSTGTIFKYTQMTDGKYTTYWETREARHNWLTVTAPGGQKIHGLYLCFKYLPDAYEVQTGSGNSWTTVYEGNGYFHAFYEFPEGASGIRIYVTSDQKQQLGLNEIFLFAEGAIPDWVQRWEPTLEGADILFFATHPDDELIFFAGGIPTAVDQGRRVAVAYLTASNTTRHSELLNGLWYLGVRNYPVIGGFRDSYQKNMTKQYQALGGEDKVNAFVAETLRRVKPLVVVTQDIDGEYGHPMHKILAQAVLTVFPRTGDAAFCPESAGTWGTWEGQKLYLHLWPENRSTFDWSRPLASFDGMTGLELADTAYRTLHITQRKSGMSVTKTGTEHDNTCFGLAVSLVGPDEAGGDWFEHIAPAETPVEELPVVEVPVEAVEIPVEAVEVPVETVEVPVETAEVPVEIVEAPAETAETPVEAVEPPVETVETPVEAVEAPAEGEAWVETDPDLQDIVPPLNAKGYLEEGEFVWSSESRGLWVYISPTLKVVVKRTYEVPDKRHPFYCFTAEIWCDVEAGELSRTVFADPAKPRSTHQFIKNIAADNQIVFATSTDYYTYRIKQTYPTGIIIRGGEVFFDEPRKNPPTMPNYETLAFFPDGHLESHASTALSARDYLDAGAYDVYCFGPCLIRDGEFTDYVATAYKSYNPRYAFGMVEPGHYVAVLCEGRLARSKGVQMEYLAQLLRDRGCQLAVNLDGGQTAVFCFMGKQLNQVVKTDPNGRAQAECLAFGTSSQVGTYQIGP